MTREKGKRWAVVCPAHRKRTFTVDSRRNSRPRLAVAAV